MRKRTNPWPAFADLFSALLIATFAGFVMISGAYQSEIGSNGAEKRKLNEALNKAREQADKITDEIQEILAKDSSLKFRPRRCGDETCIDLDINFKRSRDTIDPDQEIALGTACEAIKKALDKLSEPERKDIIITIEGHTDSQKLEVSQGPREDYLYNWKLSASRAASVLYVFKEKGLDPEKYAVVSIGYADTVKLCNSAPTDEECNRKKRRTTLKLRADISGIEERLKKAGQ